MSNLSQSLFRRREHRIIASVAYALWILSYVGAVSYPLMADPYEIGFVHLLFLVPVGLVVFQILRPTLFGWAAITLPTVFLTLALAWSLFAGRNDWPDDGPVIITACIVISAFGVVSVFLVLARPRLPMPPNTSPEPAPAAP